MPLIYTVIGVISGVHAGMFHRAWQCMLHKYNRNCLGHVGVELMYPCLRMPDNSRSQEVRRASCECHGPVLTHVTIPDATHGTAIGLPIRPGVVSRANVGVYGI